MCLVLFDFKSLNEIKILGNRDEFYLRPSSSLEAWTEDPSIYGGRDEQDGGTWLAISNTGAFGILTNYRDPTRRKDGRKSRGHIISEFLKSRKTPTNFINSYQPEFSKYNPFNLILGNKNEVIYFSNILMKSTHINPGFYGLSNHLLDTPWFKLQRAKKIYQEHLKIKLTMNLNAHFEILNDQKHPDDHALPSTGVSIEWERLLSPIFIASSEYGTRCSSVLKIDSTKAEFHERTFGPNGKFLSSKNEEIKLV